MDTVDFLIIGSGVAGLRAAIGLADAGRVLVLTKAAPTESNTGYAQGGIAAAVGEDDSPALHAEDTMRAGDGLCDEAAVRVLVERGPRDVADLIAWGARFERGADGRLALGREAAHTVRRVLHAGDATGREIGRTLWERVSTLATVTTIPDAFVVALIVEDSVVRGAMYLDERGVAHEVRARATLLATGGAGQTFRETTNPSVATGDGIALAYHAGADVADLEFVQFHPTALKLAGAPRFLISEALRGEGARLVNGRGEAFMMRYHADGDLAPRDVVARAIVRESQRIAGPIALTLAHLDGAYVERRFPTIAAMCRSVGLDLTRDPIPVGPAAHYMMGGVATDAWGRTSLAGLFAAGEVACTGVHGANRLASNSLLEGLVFGARAAEAMQEADTRPSTGSGRAVSEAAPPWKDAGRTTPQSLTDAHPSTGSGRAVPAHPSTGSGLAVPAPVDMRLDDIRDLMWQKAGLFRTRAGLTEAIDALDGMAHSASTDADGCRYRNLVTIARLITRAALRREESRGGHFREDFPERDDARWRVHMVDRQ